MTYKIIQIIVIAILVSISFLVINAQEETVVVTNEGSTEKVKQKKGTAKKQSSDEDSWTGLYLGGFNGYTNARATPNLSTVPSTFIANLEVTHAITQDGIQKTNSKGFNGGVTFGFNYQKGKFFVGGETDFGLHGINSAVSRTNLIIPEAVGITKTISQSVKSDWLFTARPRVGVAFNKTIIYVTGGVAVTNIKYNGSYSDTLPNYILSASGSFSKTKAGRTIGAGTEFKVSKHWSVKGEYLFTQFGKTSITSNNLRTLLNGPGTTTGANHPEQVFTHSTDLKSHNIRFGVNYRF